MRKTPPTPKPMGNVTIKDIADHLGISHSTVSRALADHPYTNEDTKLRVRAAVDELGYVPHAAARGLRQDRATLVGLILPELQNELAVVTAQTIAGHCLKAGLQMVLAVTGDDPQVEYQHVMALRQARARGIIITASPGMYGKTVDLLQRVPTTQFSRRHPLLTAPSVAVDGEQGVFVATQHLLQLGHTRIAYVGMDVDKSTGAERLAGYVPRAQAGQHAHGSRTAALGAALRGFRSRRDRRTNAHGQAPDRVGVRGGVDHHGRTHGVAAWRARSAARCVIGRFRRPLLVRIVESRDHRYRVADAGDGRGHRDPAHASAAA